VQDTPLPFIGLSALIVSAVLHKENRRLGFRSFSKPAAFLRFPGYFCSSARFAL
jgi:hypothetical protein